MEQVCDHQGTEHLDRHRDGVCQIVAQSAEEDRVVDQQFEVVKTDPTRCPDPIPGRERVAEHTDEWIGQEGDNEGKGRSGVEKTP
jgi:hypothetical protein